MTSAYVSTRETSNVAEIADGLFQRDKIPFSEVKRHGLNGLGFHTFGLAYGSRDAPRETYTFVLDPLEVGSMPFWPLNPEQKVGRDLHLLMYLNSVTVQHTHYYDEIVKRRYLVGPEVSRERKLRDESLSVNFEEKKQPQLLSIFPETEIVPLYDLEPLSRLVDENQ